ncbi:MAG TPA: family 16 glycosylhydrolase [Terracidiphilus sp.]|nr:family 16 glycosylhydrolase [Terracidiphilus sp.]
MKQKITLAALIPLVGALMCSCGAEVNSAGSPRTGTQVAAPVLTATSAQNGAVIVHLSAADGTEIHFTVDGSTPTAASQTYFAPFLVSSALAVKAIAVASGNASPVTTQSFTTAIPAGTLVWSDEFTQSSTAAGQPDPQVWTYDTGNSGFGNHELENYCAWGADNAPCSTSSSNAYVGADNLLHIVARQPSAGVYTSARLKTQGLFSFQYGRLEARLKLPEGAGMWPAFWLLGNSIAKAGWPASGELDVMEHIDGSNPKNEGFDWVQGSIHGTGLDGGTQYHPVGFSAADWHTYGLIWSPGRIEYYVDDPSNVYATFTAATQAGTWPFDSGPEFILLNLAVGGDWPGPPDGGTVFPTEMQVDYVRLYTN